jgi:predicted DNA-binding WGR domain protein
MVRQRGKTSERVQVQLGFDQVIRLTSVNPTKNRYRFYTLAFQPGLWGTVALIRSWGRQGTRGQSRIHIYSEHAAAQKEAHRLLRRRLQHGYEIAALQ